MGDILCPVCNQGDKIWKLTNFVEVNGNTDPTRGPEKFLEGYFPDFAEILEEARPVQPREPVIFVLTEPFAEKLIGKTRYQNKVVNYQRALAIWQKRFDLWDQAYICTKHMKVFVPDANLVMGVVEFANYISRGE